MRRAVEAILGRAQFFFTGVDRMAKKEKKAKQRKMSESPQRANPQSSAHDKSAAQRAYDPLPEGEREDEPWRAHRDYPDVYYSKRAFFSFLRGENCEDSYILAEWKS